jgi:hypothetical protein
MEVKVVWNVRDWAQAVVELPVGGRPTLSHRARAACRYRACATARADSKQTAARTCRNTFHLAHDCRGGSAPVRRGRVRAGRRSSPRNATVGAFSLGSIPPSFPFDLLRSAPGWDHAFARTISDLEGAALRPDDVDASGVPQLEDVLTIWRALDQSAGRSWTGQRIYLEAAFILEQDSETRSVRPAASGRSRSHTSDDGPSGEGTRVSRGGYLGR